VQWQKKLHDMTIIVGDGSLVANNAYFAPAQLAEIVAAQYVESRKRHVPRPLPKMSM
jgi:hypothetical protein